MILRLPFGVRIVLHLVRVTSRAARAPKVRPAFLVLEGGTPDPEDPPEPVALLTVTGRVH
jgi:hypothetical protein